MILNILLIALGVFEIVSNLFHISRKTPEAIGKSARKQHQELPKDIPDRHYFYKAVIMLVFGFIFTAAGTLSVLHASISPPVLRAATIGFGLYGLIQAVLYRKEVKVWPAAVVYNIPLLMLVFI